MYAQTKCKLTRWLSVWINCKQKWKKTPPLNFIFILAMNAWWVWWNLSFVQIEPTWIYLHDDEFGMQCMQKHDESFIFKYVGFCKHPCVCQHVLLKIYFQKVFFSCVHAWAVCSSHFAHSFTSLKYKIR